VPEVNGSADRHCLADTGRRDQQHKEICVDGT
jgi:hypothetical protein